MKRLPPSVERITAGVTLSLGFLVMASVFAPDWTRAEHTRTPEAGGPASAALPLSLGTLEHGRYRVLIHAGSDGPRFSIYDTADGRLLAPDLTAEEVARRFPDLPLPDLDFTATENVPRDMY